jgi:hypothetical protein
MKRLVLPATALVLVVTACGAGAKPAPQPAEAGAQLPSVHELVAERRNAALREARRLVREFVPPPGARPDRAQRDHGGILRRSGPEPLGEDVGALRFWRVRKPLKAVVAFLKAHDPHGFRNLSATYGSRLPHYLIRTLANGRGRYLDETIDALPGRTIIRVEAKVAWVYPRSPREKVPPRTTKIVITAPKTSANVTDPVQVAQIVRWFDALPISPPGIAIACPLEIGPDITLSFRSTTGAWLAQSKLPPRAASICDTILFQIAGTTMKPLIDGNVRDSFIRRLQRLLGVQLVRTYH